MQARSLAHQWFVGLAIDDEVWDHSVFSKNRDRLLEHAVVERFFTGVMQLAERAKLLSKEHFSVDGTLIQAWASHKSFVPKDGGGPGSGGAAARPSGELKRCQNVSILTRWIDISPSFTEKDTRASSPPDGFGGRPP